MHESSLAKWLRYLIYASALVPVVIFSQFLSPFHFGKVVIFRSIVEIMAVLYLLLIWRDASYRPKSHPIVWAFLAFAVVFTITSFTGVAFLQSFWGTLERMGGLFTFWHYFVFYVIAVSVLRTKEDWRPVFDLMISAGLVSAVYGFLQRFSIEFIIGADGRPRIFGTIGNPALFAGYQILIAYLAATLCFTRTIGPQAGVSKGSALQGMRYIGFGLVGMIVVGLLATPVEWLAGLWVVPLTVAVYGIYLFIAESFKWGRLWYAGVAFLAVLAAAMTAVRGSLVAMVIATIVFVLLWTIYYHSRRARSLLVGTIGAIIIFIFLGLALQKTPLIQNSGYLKRVTDFSLNSFTVQTRFWAWEAGLKGFSENPRTVLIGWGPENFNVPFSKYFNPKFYTGPGAETFFDRAHNMFVEVLVTMGIVGELAYLSIFGALFWTLGRLIRREGDERVLGIGMIALTIAYIIHNAFIFDTSANFITFFLILAFVTALAQRGIQGAVVPSKPARAVPESRWTSAQTSTAVILSLILCIAVYQFNVRPTAANFTVTRGIVTGWQGDFIKALNKYREAITYDVPGRYEYRHRYAEYLLQVSTATDIKKITGFEQVTLDVIEDLKHNIQENPQDYLPYLYISRLYLTLGNGIPTSPHNVTALEYSQKALAISPTFIRTYYEIGQAYLNMQKYEKAAEIFAKAAELNPDVGITWWYAGALALETGNTEEGLVYVQRAIERGYGLNEQDAQKLINAFLDKGDFISIIKIYEQLTTNHPANAQYWASLAAAYEKVGRIQDAINAVRKAMAANPNDAEFIRQANAYLRQLGAQ